jgi:threonine 3-dehydrogenase
MKAVKKQSSSSGADIVDVPIPKVEGDAVLCKVLAASICGTDVHIYNWDNWAQKRIKPPIIFGHEFCGEVVETGPKAKHIKAGDRISAETHIPCHTCKQCKSGQMHICKNLKILGVDTDGCFAEYAILPEICCVKNAPSLSAEIASVQEPLGNAVYAVTESDVAGKTVAIFGDGPTGMFANIVARAYNAKKIFAVGAQSYRLDILKRLNPDIVIDARTENASEIIMNATSGDGADVVIEMSGSPKAIHSGLKVVSPGGIFTFFGIPSRPVELDIAEEIIFKGIKINAIVGRKMFETWTQVSFLLESGRIDLTPVITHTFALDQIASAMELLKPDNIQAGKIILKP